MTRLRIDLAYDGGGFYGWAKQPNLRTVQGTIEDALHKVLRVPADDAAEPLRLTVAGRTDTGVHASHQVAHLDVSDEVLNRCVGHMTIPVTEALTRRLKAVLPPDIVIHGIAVAPVGFDARFSALSALMCIGSPIVRLRSTRACVDAYLPWMKRWIWSL